MTNILLSLAWKEWHEHKWKLVSITAVMWGVTALTMLLSDQDRFNMAQGMLLTCIVPLAAFVGLSAAASERSRGTLPFLQALPVPTSYVAQTKLVMGLATVIVPVVLTVLSFYLWKIVFDFFGVDYQDAFDSLRVAARGLGPFTWINWYFTIAMVVAGIAASLFIWSAALGVNRKDEVSAGAFALAVIVGWTTFIYYVIDIAQSNGQAAASWWVPILLSTAPGGVISVDEFHLTAKQVWLGLFLMVIFHLALAGSYVRRFGQIRNREIRSPQVASDTARSGRLAPPRHSPLTAIAWKQMRESGPIALAGVAGIFAIVLLMFGTQGSNMRLADDYTVVSIAFGFFGIALVVGIGVVLQDLGPQLNTFWRSRPINPDLWFWTKFATGLAILGVTIHAPLVLFTMFVDSRAYDPDMATLIPTLHFAIFAVAVATTCLVRHAVYAAILSMAVLYIGVVLVGMLVSLRLGTIEWAELLWQWRAATQTEILTGLTATFVTCTLVAWLAVRYDWGRKSRY